MIPELIIAEKEFRDCFSSKRFLIIFVILLLLSFYGVYTGIDNYNQRLEQYNNDQQTATSLYNPPALISMPSILEVFSSMVIFFAYLGMILGAAMGFDLISGEKEEGSLKFLITSPIYRDAIINGKTIGAIASLAVVLAATFLIAIAIMMFKGVVPGLDDMARIVVFFIFSLLYCMVFFAIAMMMSTITRSASMSVICTVGLVVVLILFSILSPIASTFIANAIVGPAPPISYVTTNTTDSAGVLKSSSTTVGGNYLDYTNKLVSTEFQISDTITTFSPLNDFGGMLGLGIGGIGDAILSKTQVQTTSPVTTSSATQSATQISLLNSLASVWMKILVIIIEIVVAFSVSYIAFMRMDI